MNDTKTTHTPGPWKPIPWADQASYTVAGAHDAPLANVTGQGEANLANARLIAAAPAMLDALIYAVNYCDEEGSGVPTAWEDLAQILRAVISIARGR